MSWFFIALFAPALWSITNHIDKYLISKYLSHSSAISLLMFSSLFGLFALPFILIFEPNIFNIGLLEGLLSALSGLLYILSLIPYIYALRRDEASIVVPIFQIIPIFGYILAYFFLGETLTTRQILASLLILTGAIAISLELKGNSAKLKIDVFLAMLISSVILAFVDFLFKFVGIKTGFWTTAFWSYAGYLIFAVFVLLFTNHYRKEFLALMKQSSISLVGLNFFNETVNILGLSLYRYATLLAPLALVQVVNGFQPFFVFVYGVILTLLFPRFGTENIAKRHLLHKLLAIAIIFVGTYLLNS